MSERLGTDEYTFVKHYRSQIDVFTGWIQHVSRGISGKVKILYYDLEKLVRFGGIVTALQDGTFITMDNGTWMFILFSALAFTFVFVMVLGWLDEGQTVETEPLERVSSTMNQVVPFLLSLYLSLSLTRWWTVREGGLAEIFSATVNMQMFVACLMYPERLKAVRTLIMKWCFASVFLLLKAVRHQRDLNDMLYKGLLTEPEIKVLLKVEDLEGRPYVVWTWVLRLVHESFSECCGPMPYSTQVSKAADICMSASNGFSIIQIHLATALPFVYVHLITLLVDINNLFFLAKSATVAAVAMKEKDYARFGCELIFVFVVPTIYRGLLCISYAIHDPFGEDVLHFPVGSIMDWNASCCYAVLQAQERFPGVPDSVYSVSRGHLHAATSGKLSERDPEAFEAMRSKFFGIVLNAFRSGKLEAVARKMHNKLKRDGSLAATIKITNVKSSAAMLSATKSAKPVADELQRCGKNMRAELIRLRQQVYELQRAVNQDSLSQHTEVHEAINAGIEHGEDEVPLEGQELARNESGTRERIEATDIIALRPSES